MTGTSLARAPSATLALRILESNAREIGAVIVDLAEKDEAFTVLNEVRALDHTPAAYCAAFSSAAVLVAQNWAEGRNVPILWQAEDLPRLLGAAPVEKDEMPPAQLVLFAPAQEGAGASTTALHAAAALSRDHGVRTLFAELDYHSDSVACRLRIAGAKSLSDLAPGENWRSALTHWDGLHVLAAPQAARVTRRRGLPDLPSVLEDTGYDYDIVIGDLPCNTAVATPRVLALAERIYVVATAEVTSLYLARRRILELCTVGAKRSAIRLIINRNRPGVIDSEVALQVTGLEPSCRLPNDFVAASEAETEGRTVSATSALGHAYARLAAEILGKPAPAVQTETRGWGRFLTAWR